MLIKAGVDISRLKRETRRALGIVEDIYTANNELFVVSSTYEGNHSAGSLHYANDAFDVRKPEAKWFKIRDEIRATLGSNFDVVGEVDHIHIEHDPKG